MGVSKAVGQTLLGATNSLDPGNRRRMEDVSHILSGTYEAVANPGYRNTRGTRVSHIDELSSLHELDFAWCFVSKI